jgi:hypothetical protein
MKERFYHQTETQLTEMNILIRRGYKAKQEDICESGRREKHAVIENLRGGWE